MSIFSELKRRNVYRVAGLYIIVSWLVLQVGDVFMSFLPLPDWTPNLVFVLLVLGFPIALVLAWAFELTPDGIRREATTPDKAAKQRAFRPTDLVLMLALAGIGVYVFMTREAGDSLQPVPTDQLHGTIDSIVVLPLEDLTNDPEQAYFVAGMHEALITELSKVEALRVISRTSAMAYQDSDKSLPQIASELGVDAVVEGSVLRAGNDVRVTAQLIDAQTDRHLWADNYDRPMTDILELYGEVAGAIVEQIRVQVTPEEISRLSGYGKVNPEAYNLYLQGRFLCNKWGPQDMARGTDLLRQAVENDPGSAPAWAELGLCLQYRAFYNFIRPLDALEESRSAALRAIELDNALAESHVARAGVAHFMEYDLARAEFQLQQAINLNPGSVKARIHLSWLLGGSGRFDGAVQQALKAIELDPLNTISHHTLGEAYFLARDFDRALQAYERALALGPNDPSLNFSVSQVEGERGNMDRALELGSKSIELSGGASIFLGGYGYLLGLSGATDEAREVLQKLLTRETVYPFDVAVVHVGLGEYEEAIDQLELAYQQRNSQLHYLAEGSAFDPLRDYPRFQALLDRLDWN